MKKSLLVSLFLFFCTLNLHATCPRDLIGNYSCAATGTFDEWEINTISIKDLVINSRSHFEITYSHPSWEKDIFSTDGIEHRRPSYQRYIAVNRATCSNEVIDWKSELHNKIGNGQTEAISSYDIKIYKENANLILKMKGTNVGHAEEGILTCTKN